MPRRSARLNASAAVASDEPEAVDADEVSYSYPDPDQQPSYPWLGGAKVPQYDINEDEDMIDDGNADAWGNHGMSMICLVATGMTGRWLMAGTQIKVMMTPDLPVPESLNCPMMATCGWSLAKD